MNKWIFATLTILALVILAFLFIPTLTVPPRKAVNISSAILAGKDFLVTSIHDDKYGLSCKSDSTALPCPPDMHGKAVTEFFILDVLHELGAVPASFKQAIAKRLNEEKYGTDENNYWGYKLNAPPDADDTAFALRTLIRLGEKVQADGLEKFYDPDQKTYGTFIPTGPQKPAIEPSSTNNRNIHPAVIANVYLLFQELHLASKINIAALEAFQAPEGYWHRYFYPGKFYTTYMSMKVLCNMPSTSTAVKNGINFILESQNKDGSWGSTGNAYDTALALNTLMACHDRKSSAVKNGVQYLLTTQNEKGYWSSNQPVWEYVPSDVPRIVWSSYDVNHALTTALALEALITYQSENTNSH